MWSRGFHVDALVYNVAFKAVLNRNDWVRVLSTFEDLLRQGARPVAMDSSCSTAMLAAGHGSSWQRLPRRNTNPGTAGYNTAVAACLRGRDWVRAMDFFVEMDQLHIEVDVFTFSSLISTLKEMECGCREKAMEVFLDMRGRNLTADVITMNAAISSVATGQEAMDLLRETQQQVHLGDGISMSRWQVMIFCQELEADVFSYSTVLGIETRWQNSISIVQEMEDMAMEPGAVALSAMFPWTPWDMAVITLCEQQKRQLQPDEVLCGSVLNTFESSLSPWLRLVDYWRWMSCVPLPISSVAWSSAIRTLCASAQWMCAALVLEEFPKKTEMESSMVASLYATILDQMEHQTDPDGSHMEVINRMAASPVADGLGVASAVASLTDFFFRCLNDYKQNLKQVAPLKQFDDVDNHANRLFEQIEKSRSVIVPSLQGLPKQPIRDTKFTALMREILRDTKTAVLSAVYAEPGVVCDAKRANDVAWRLFSLLRANNKRLHIIFDNTFDNGVDKTSMLIDLARAAFAHGHHIVAITQSKKSAEEIADLNGERTRLAPQQQQDDRTYRWSRRQAQKYLETMEEEMVSPNEPKEREEFIGKVLNNTLIPDDVGLWRPVAINEYMKTGHKPKAPQRARTSAPVWVRQLVKDCGRKQCAIEKKAKLTIPAFMISVSRVAGGRRKTKMPSSTEALQSRTATATLISSRSAVFSELVNRLFQAVRVETVSPEGFLSGCRGISFWGIAFQHENTCCGYGVDLAI
eukprot:symbB.v1.2.012858.t1/scaffold875.1/size155714/7